MGKQDDHDDEHDYRDDDGGGQGDGEVTRIEALDERFGRIESEQAEHRQLLEQIRDAIGAGRRGERRAHDAAQQHTERRLEQPPAATMADQVRQAVKDVNAEEEQKRASAQHQADHDRIREMAERAPRETISGFRGRLRKAMYGADQ